MSIPKAPTPPVMPSAPVAPTGAPKPVGRVQGEVEKKFKEIVKSLGKTCYSYSRLSVIHECQYGYYQSYILRNKGRGNVYSFLGSIVHDVLESYTNGEIKYEEMLPTFDAAYNKACLAGLKFPSDAIRIGYIDNLRSFFQEYEIPKADEILTEAFICGSFGGEHNQMFMQGFIDETYCYTDDDGKKHVVISDHKSSTKFKEKDLLKYGRQLVLYAVMYEKFTGIPVDRVQWNMMKYLEVTFRGKWVSEFGKLKATELKDFLIDKCGEEESLIKKLKKAELVEIGLQYKEIIAAEFNFDMSDKKIVYQRKDIYNKLVKHMLKLDIEQSVLDEFKEHNLYSKLPEAVKSTMRDAGIQVNPFYELYEITEEIKDEMENYLLDSIALIESKEGKGEHAYPPKDIAKDEFFCRWLCNHGDTCKYFKQYLNVKHGLN